MKILVADDSENIRAMFGDLLTEWDYQPVFAKDGEEAWSALNDVSPPRIALIDWMMPRIDGLELCKKVKTDINIPFYIILVTAKSSVEDVIKGLVALADDFLSNPLEPDELRSRIEIGSRILDYENKIKSLAQELQQTNKEKENLVEEIKVLKKKLEDAIK